MSAAAVVLELDECSALVHAAANARVDAIDEALAARSLALPTLPHDSRRRTLGDTLSDPRPSEATPRGRFVDACAALTALLPDGTRIETRLAPRRAAGPDPVAALIGARGAHGRITSAWMRLARTPQHAIGRGFVFLDGEEALARARIVLARGVLPTHLELVDVERPGDSGATLVLLRLEGARDVVLAEERLALEVLGHASGGIPLPPVEATARIARGGGPTAHGRFVPAAALAAAWAVRARPARLIGFRHAGAALCSAASGAPDQPEAHSAVADIRIALQQRLAAGGAD